MSQRSLSPKQFMQRFSPSEYGQSWPEVTQSEDFAWTAPGADDEQLKRDIAANGITNPVLVHKDGYVVDGHHRAVYAAEHGHPVPYETTDQWLYEGQDPRRRS